MSTSSKRMVLSPRNLTTSNSKSGAWMSSSLSMLESYLALFYHCSADCSHESMTMVASSRVQYFRTPSIIGWLSHSFCLDPGVGGGCDRTEHSISYSQHIDQLLFSPLTCCPLPKETLIKAKSISGL